MNRLIPLAIVTVLLLAVAVVGCVSIAFASVGRVGSIGTMMSPNASAGGLPPSNPFAITTEVGAPLATESNAILDTEAAP